MTDGEANPYSPPGAATDVSKVPASEVRRGFRWRTLPATVIFGLGLAFTVFGLVGVCGIVFQLLTQEPSNSQLAKMLTISLTYLGFGTAWVSAGFVYWKSRLWIAVFITVIGMLFPTAGYAIWHLIKQFV